MIDSSQCARRTGQRDAELLLAEIEPANQLVTRWAHVQFTHQRRLTAPLGLVIGVLIKS